MPLTGVTISGVDDKTDLDAIVGLRHRYSFVEFAALFSANRLGTPRYPSIAWMIDLSQSLSESRAHRHAIHICGSTAKDMYEGNWDIFSSLMDVVGIGKRRTNWRIQINAPPPVSDRFFAHAKLWHRMEFILQARDGFTGPRGIVERVGKRQAPVSILYDPSGGRGIETASWPAPPPAIPVGYAGGIKPSNVVEVVSQLSVMTRNPFWIDMESGVRDEDDCLDIAKVTDVLQKCEPFVSKT